MSGDTVTIGAATTHAEVATSDAIRKAIPALAALAGLIGDPAVRHRGTIGGSLANNDPAADYPAAVHRPRRDHPHQQAHDRRRPVLHRPLHDRARGRRDHHQGRLPGAGQGGLRQVPQPGLALCHDRRLRRQDEGRQGPRRRHRRRRQGRLPRQPTSRARSPTGRPTPSTASPSTRTACSPTSTARPPTAPTSSRSWPSARCRPRADTPCKVHGKGGSDPALCDVSGMALLSHFPA